MLHINVWTEYIDHVTYQINTIYGLDILVMLHINMWTEYIDHVIYQINTICGLEILIMLHTKLIQYVDWVN